LGDLSNPAGSQAAKAAKGLSKVQKLQMALHAKAKAEADYRFYALYDKIYREDILERAYFQCRSNKGAPGVDRQDFADVEAYGVKRWLGELALALREETYRPQSIRWFLVCPTASLLEDFVYSESQRQTPAAGHLNLARSGLHDSSHAVARCLSDRAEQESAGTDL
jgi:hypothetical protein